MYHIYKLNSVKILITFLENLEFKEYVCYNSNEKDKVKSMIKQLKGTTIIEDELNLLLNSKDLYIRLYSSNIYYNSQKRETIFNFNEISHSEFQLDNTIFELEQLNLKSDLLNNNNLGIIQN